MNITLSIFESNEPQKREKGKSIISLPENYVIVDLETTGLDSHYDEIIEFAAYRVRNGNKAETFNSLAKPKVKIGEYITQLTGITNEMLKTAPKTKDVLSEFLGFVGDDIVIGHNVNFDINFLCDCSVEHLGKPFVNNYIDTLRIARKLYPELSHHRLRDLTEYFNFTPNGFHRALADCETTYFCYNRMKQDILKQYETEEAFSNLFKKKKHNAKDFHTENTEFDETNPLFGKSCVFTGTLEKMPRKEAFQHVYDLGGVCENSVTKKTNYLILGNNDYCKSIKDGKSSKQKKAEEYALKGYDIEIITENVFYDMLASD